MNRLIIFTAASMLAACQPVSTTANDVPAASQIASVRQPYEGVFKFCDAGRAIYVFDGYKQGGIAVVENAAECQPGMRP